MRKSYANKIKNVRRIKEFGFVIAMVLTTAILIAAFITFYSYVG